MKRDFALKVTLAAAVAVSVSACGGPSSRYDYADDYAIFADRDTAVCTDQKTQKRVDDKYCSRGSGGGGIYGWYYMGRNSTLPYVGDSVRGGTYTRTAGATYFHAPKSVAVTRAAAVSRGGFGSSARSYGGFRGGVSS